MSQPTVYTTPASSTKYFRQQYDRVKADEEIQVSLHPVVTFQVLNLSHRMCFGSQVSVGNLPYFPRALRRV